MKSALIVLIGLLLGDRSVHSADADLKASVALAAQRQAEQASCKWKKTRLSEGGGSLGDGNSISYGKFEMDCYHRVSDTSSQDTYKFAVKANRRGRP